MSDSDDTEVLLLIPPDLFIIDSSRENSFENNNCLDQYCYSSFGGLQTEHMSNNYNFLPPNKQYELDRINATLAHVDKNYSGSSEISSISNCTVKSTYKKANDGFGNDYYNRNCKSPTKFVHSTPKKFEYQQYSDNQNIKPAGSEGGVLNEIDQFLQKKSNLWSNGDNHKLLPPNEGSQYAEFAQPSSLPISNNRYGNLRQTSQQSEWTNIKSQEDPLISLSHIWGSDGRTEQLSLHEERLRRQHCEKTIQALQSRLLEYQQRLSVAIQVDKAKDAALEKQMQENSNFKKNLEKLENQMRELETQKDEYRIKVQEENEELKNKKSFLEKELAQALSLVSKFQDKNEILELKAENLSKSSSEVGTLFKKQIEDLEIRISNAQRSEQIANEELKKCQNQLAKCQVENEKLSKQYSELEKQIESFEGEIEILKQQKSNAFLKYKEERERANLLDKHKKDLEETLTNLNKKEKTLLQDLENQKNSLKAHYQQQLEQVVAQKLKEFQSQLDSVEETLKTEAKDRERLIAERAIKQMELINEKNEQEINLLLEKQREEIELYRIQLVNASKKIDELQEKLNLYKSRRADIAEKLHNVMETQWKKALEILTSPNTNAENTFHSINPKNIDRERLDGVCKGKDGKRPENESFETPTSSRNRKIDQHKTDRLQAYIEMLLSKSPRDFDNLDEILLMPKTSSSGQNSKCDKSRNRGDKPPWK